MPNVLTTNSRSKRTSRTAQKHHATLYAAAEIFLANGFVGTSMDNFAAQAGVSKQTFYAHFVDKRALFAAMVDDLAGEAGARVQINMPDGYALHHVLKAQPASR